MYPHFFLGDTEYRTESKMLICIIYIYRNRMYSICHMNRSYFRKSYVDALDREKKQKKKKKEHTADLKMKITANEWNKGEKHER